MNQSSTLAGVCPAALLLLVSAFAGLPAKADFVGVFLGGGGWRASTDGTVTSVADLDATVSLEEELNTYVYFAFEHPAPILPNIRLERTAVDGNGTGRVISTTPLPNVVVPASFDITSTDVTLYYQLVDTLMDLDLGLTARYMDGDVRVDDNIEDFSDPLPMVYARAKFDLPLTGTYVQGDINAISYQGSNFTDYSVAMGWETENFLLPEFGIEVGYRHWSLTLDADEFDVGVDLKLDGVFANLTAHF